MSEQAWKWHNYAAGTATLSNGKESFHFEPSTEYATGFNEDTSDLDKLADYLDNLERRLAEAQEERDHAQEYASQCQDATDDQEKRAELAEAQRDQFAKTIELLTTENLTVTIPRMELAEAEAARYREALEAIQAYQLMTVWSKRIETRAAAALREDNK